MPIVNTAQSYLHKNLECLDFLYYDVFVEEHGYLSPYYNDSIHVDTIFYNYEFGILQLSFSDGDTYNRIE